MSLRKTVISVDVNDIEIANVIGKIALKKCVINLVMVKTLVKKVIKKRNSVMFLAEERENWKAGKKN